MEYAGRWVVPFFYPRDFTFVCPTEIASFAELHADFDRENAVVIGASTDSFYSHKAWFESDPRLSGVSTPSSLTRRTD
ncbi:MAG: redoxin domain-containing protein [Actinomycetota bacterium]